MSGRSRGVAQRRPASRMVGTSCRGKVAGHRTWRCRGGHANRGRHRGWPAATAGEGYIVPDAFTHGSSEQRVRWFMNGLKSGQVSSCDTYQVAEPW